MLFLCLSCLPQRNKKKEPRTFSVQVRGPRNHLLCLQESPRHTRERSLLSCRITVGNFLGFGLAFDSENALYFYYFSFFCMSTSRLFSCGFDAAKIHIFFHPQKKIIPTTRANASNVCPIPTTPPTTTAQFKQRSRFARTMCNQCTGGYKV